MSEFYDVLDEYIGDADDQTEIRAVVRRCWFYDFNGYPVRIWQGKGKLFTSDGNEWLGSVDANNNDIHDVPRIQDGRDGSSASYTMTLKLVDVPGQTAFQAYEALKADQWRVTGRKLTCYLAIFKVGEALRPSTPLSFFKEFIMLQPRFSEALEGDGDGHIIRRYVASVMVKDNNFGRTNTPRRTYADTMQKQRAIELGVGLDRGAEFLAGLANRTYQIP